MKPELLMLSPIYEPTTRVLEQEYTVHKLWEQPDAAAYLRTPHPEIRAAVTNGVAGFRGEQIANLPKLEIIACFGVAHGTLDLASTRPRGIAVTNTPDDSTNTVADLALGLMLAVMRRIAESDRYVRAGKWEQKPFPMGSALTGKTCGIVGLGNIGRGIAKRAEACAMKVAYFGPRKKSDVAYAYYDTVEALARDSDCLVLACPERPDTRHLVTAKVLEALGAGGFLVNIARGSVVDEQALLAALKNGTIAGAGLDVYWKEPAVPAELRGMDNVVLSAHIGTSTNEIRQERSELLLGNLRAHFAGKALLTPVK
jgi:lactate dehydrogenase-like 2-hydroxyacid dehydrogenase